MNKRIEVIFESLIPYVMVFSTVVGFIGSEFLIFYNPEARADWSRMLPPAIFSPFMFTISIVGIIGGLMSVILIPVYFTKYILGQGHYDKLMVACIIAGIGLISGGGTVVRWIKYIVIDNYPAFGYNPDNVYAVTGINTMFYLPLAAIVGIIVGLIVFGILLLIGTCIKELSK